MRINRTAQISEIKRAAKYRWLDILVGVGVNADCLKDRHGPCPGCGGKDRFRFDDKDGDGTFICSQGGADPVSGDGLDLLQHVFGWNVHEAAQAVAPYIGFESGTVRYAVDYAAPIGGLPERLTEDDGAQKRRQKLRAIWQGAFPLDGRDPASCYLLSRGIRRADDWPTALRCHPALPYWVSHPQPRCLGSFPALIARIQDIQGRGVSLQRIYLGNDGQKLVLADPQTGEMLPAKKAMSPIDPGALSGAAVHLDEPEGGRIMLAEGVETALAAGSLSKWPVWACISAHGLQRVQLPPAIVQVVIAADRDASGTGQRAAEILANRLVKEGREVRILLPEQDGRDWADVAMEVSHDYL